MLHIARKGFYSPGSSFVQSRSLVPDRDGKTLEDLAPKASGICSCTEHHWTMFINVYLDKGKLLVLSLASVVNVFIVVPM